MVNYQVVFSGLVSSNHVLVQERSGSVAIDTVCLSVKSSTIATDSRPEFSSLFSSDSNSGDESENNNDSP